MRRILCACLAGACALLSALAGVEPLQAQSATPAGMEFFEKRIRPLLVESCYPCHSAKARHLKGGLLLDSRAGLLRGGDSGPALVPGQSARSRLVEAVDYTNSELHMPPRGKLPGAAIANLKTWVAMGAPWPAEHGTASIATGPGFDLMQRKRSHWAWQPVRRAAPPGVKDAHWPRSPIDRFILARLEERGLKPAAEADRHTWLRRVSLDLIGLPPTRADIEAFLHDSSPDAHARVVDRLLASPHFGERWGRHWLDLTRYAESRGHEFDYTAPNAYRFRDYVIRALNLDLPYDQFVTEQIAGDLLPRPRLNTSERFNESVLGTGFWLLGEELHSPVDVRQDQADRIDNQIDVFSKTFLGMTLACARCHDHKFDAISARDYYALYGILESSSYRLARFDSCARNQQVAHDLRRFDEQARPVIQRAVAEAMRPAVERLAVMLEAARQAMLAGWNGNAADEKLRHIGQAHHVDPALVARWVTHLRAAQKDRTDPFYGMMSGAGAASDHLPSSMPGPDEVVIDYACPKPGEWITDGFNFGAGPAQAGSVQLGLDPARPIVRVSERAAAEHDPVWDRVHVAPGEETDPGPLGSVPRPGRTLCTPWFVIRPGKLYYLVRGKGFAYAAVDGHSLINGPLHGQLIQRFDVGPEFHWAEHDLSAYTGQRTHIEFAPAEGANFAVAKVIQTQQRPGERPPLRFQGEPAEIQRRLLGAVDRLANDRLVGASDTAGAASIANWLVQHPDLFPADAETRRQRDAMVKPLMMARAKLCARIQRKSRLAMAMADVSPVDEHVFVRGSPKVLGAAVPRRFLQALTDKPKLQRPWHTGSGRLELARAVTDPRSNPLAARVIVNRVWHHLFGRGIVPSVDNFGVLGERPTHPELLDYLADQFVHDGWSIKRLIRRLVLSSTYRMSSQPDAMADRSDPQDQWLHRMRLRRIEGEVIRDAMLAISGRLDERLYGRAVPIYLTPFQEGRGRPATGPLDGAGRRSVYLAVRRNFLSPFLLAFDTPIPFSTVGKRTVSNVPAQSLILMNDPFVHQQAGVWAARILREPGSTAERISDMYLSAFGRSPSAIERQACRDFLRKTPQTRDERAAWADLAQVLFNVKEFIYVP